MTGAPDFLRINTQSGAPFINAASVATTGGITYGPFPTAIWQSMVLSVTPTQAGGMMRVTITHWADPAGTIVLGTVIYNTRNGTPLSDQVALYGQAVSVTILSLNAPANDLVTVVAAPTNAGARPARSAAPTGLLLRAQPSLAAGGGEQAYCTQVLAGNVVVNIEALGTGLDITFQVVYLTDPTNSGLLYSVRYNTTGRYDANFPLLLPPAVVYTNVLNNSGANALGYTVSITPTV